MLNRFAIYSPAANLPDSLRQSVYITNVLSSILSILTIILFGILFSLFGWKATSILIISISVLFGIVPLINKRYYNFGRFLFCLLPVYVTFAISVYGKIKLPEQSYITYFDIRFILLVTTILPTIAFTMEEKRKIGVCMGSTLLCLVLFDPIHNALGLGYFQRGFSAQSYYYINYITFISFLVLSFGVVVLKAITSLAEAKVKKSMLELNLSNRQLLIKNDDLMRLNESMAQQSEELIRQKKEIHESRELIAEANLLISQQQEKLIESNRVLEKLVVQKTEDLSTTNEELVRHNNELRQFSYTVSHNLRGPVARLLGLTDLFTKPISAEEKIEIGHMINKSGHELDGVLHDLSLIIDIRNDLYQVREKISFEVELTKTVSMLRDQIRPTYQIDVDFSEAPFVYSIRAMIQSILYNLLSNAIKYRNPERDLKITIKTTRNFNRDVTLRVSDNGLGFNVLGQKENLFKLYKRFHTHVDGKGLGLYLIKTQVDTLGGKIEIQSEINRGATFEVMLPTPRNVSKQVFFDGEAAQIYYDADINNTVIVWKKNITSLEYRRSFQAVLHTLKTFNTPGWIADLRLQGKVADEDQRWFMSTVITEAVHCGLKRIAAVGFYDPIRKEYYERMKERTAELGIELRVFQTHEEAILWMEGFVQRS